MPGIHAKPGVQCNIKMNSKVHILFLKNHNTKISTPVLYVAMQKPVLMRFSGHKSMEMQVR